MKRSKTKKVKNTTLLIYNPNAGKKRKVVNITASSSLDSIKSLLEQYQIPVDAQPTKGPGDATTLAKDSIKKGYTTVIVAGGDGTVGEAINGLIGSDTTLGIIPLGSVMNIARMLSIPFDIEKAIQIIKINRTRKIDMGVVTKLDGEKLAKQFYFMESAGVGMDAYIFSHFRDIEKGDILSLFPLLVKLFRFSPQEFTITTDQEEVVVKAQFITVANGPYSGTMLKTAPNAKLNDRRLTVVVYYMPKLYLLRYFLTYLLTHKTDLRKVKTLQAKTVKIVSKNEILVHADGSKYGTTPVSFKIYPGGLSIICGFPPVPKDTSLAPKAPLDQ